MARAVRPGGAVVVLTGVALLAGCGGAGPLPGAAGGTALTVVLDPDGPDRPGATVTGTLTCDPPGGDLTDPAAACDQLAAVGVAGFDPVGDAICTEQYGGPEIATVTGTVAGEDVDTTFARTNGCEIDRWTALSAVLPPGG